MEQIRKGTVLGGWSVVRPLGRGAMGVVFLAEGPGGERAAVKVLTLSDDRALRRFQREVAIGKEIRHPNVIRVLEGGEFRGLPYLVMEFVEGNDLGAISKARGRLAPGHVLELSRQLAAGLRELHRRELVHRDLKPDNLMIDREGVLKIMDLGLIRDPDATALTKTGSLVGTPWYMAPEQVLGHAATAATDLFAVTLMLYCLLTGRHPFRRSDQTDFIEYLRGLITSEPRPWHRQGAGGPLDLFFRRGLARDPAARFDSAAELAVAFEQALHDQARGTHRSVEETLEMEVEDSGVGAFEDLEVPAEGIPVQGPGGPGPASASGSLSASSGVLSTSGRRWWVLALVAGIPLFLLSVLREGMVHEEVVVVSADALRGVEGEYLVVRTERPADLGLAGAPALARGQEGRVHLLRIPRGAGVLEVRTRRGTTVLVRRVEGLSWVEPPALRRRFDESGSLVLVVSRREGLRLGVRRPGGTPMADSSRDPAQHRFRIADPGGRGVGPLELLVTVGEVSGAWRRLERVPALAAQLDALVVALEELDAVAWMKEAGQGEDAPASLRRRLERSGLAERLGMLRTHVERLIVAREGDERLRDRLLLRLSAPMVLDAYFAAAGEKLPFGLLGSELGSAIWGRGFYGARPESMAGAAWVYEKHKDFFFARDAPYRPSGRDPTMLFVRPFTEQPLAPLESPVGDHWLVLYTSDWQANFFAEAWINDRGPFLVADDPRLDRKVAWDHDRFPDGTPERRWIRVRVPETVLGHESRVRLEMRPWAFHERMIQPFLIVHALKLEPCRASP